MDAELGMIRGLNHSLYVGVSLRVDQITEISNAGGAGSIKLPEHSELAIALSKLRSQLEVSCLGTNTQSFVVRYYMVGGVSRHAWVM